MEKRSGFGRVDGEEKRWVWLSREKREGEGKAAVAVTAAATATSFALSRDRAEWAFLAAQQQDRKHHRALIGRAVGRAWPFSGRC